MVAPEVTSEVAMVDLPFLAATRTKDGKWTLKARFATRALAGAWAIGVASAGAGVRVLEESGAGLADVTERAVGEAEAAIKRGR